MPSESEKVLTVPKAITLRRCPDCGKHDRWTDPFDADGRHRDCMGKPEPVRYLPEAETVGLEVAEPMYEALRQVKADSSFYMFDSFLQGRVRKASDTYRQSVPER